ncbi:MAG: DegV family protein [Candidatus Dormiibacterota bacterium]|jgi:DegV family protein with EDD domain
MRPVHLVCDSTADLGPTYYPAHDVELVPLRIIFGDEQFRDQVEMSTGDFYRRMRAGGPHPRTSQPPPGDFTEVFQRLGSDGGTVICTTISSDLSGTAGSATHARQSLPDLDIRVVETKSCGPALGASVAMAVAIRDRGGDADAIVAAIERLRATQRLVFTVENLEYLRRGGRIGTARALIGTVLSIKPILGFIDGKVQVLDQVRTYTRALDRLVQELASAVRLWGRTAATLAHADNREGAEALAEKVADVTGEPPQIVEVGAVLGCHVGPGAFGLFYHPASAVQT